MQILIYSIAAALFVSLVLWSPMAIVYLLLGYMVFNGYSSRPFMENVLRVTFGNVNVYPLDILFASMAMLILFYLIKRIIGISRARVISKEARFATGLIALYFLLFSGKFVAGYFEGVPPQTLIRLFLANAQCIYFFLPILFIKNEIQLRRLLYFLLFISLIFPFGQLLLVGSRDYEFILRGQGTLRLGYGDSTLFLGFAVIAFFAWERKLAAAVIPATGIAMLNHRIAYVGIVISLVSLSVLKGKKLKTNIILGLMGVLVIGVLFVVQETTSIRVLDKGIERVAQTFEKTGTTAARIGAIPQTFDVLVEHPIVGLGYGDLYKLQERTEISALAFNILHSHNFFLTALSHTGLVGTILILWIIWHALSCARRLSRMAKKKETGSFLFACILFFIIEALASTTLYSAGFLFWILCGIVFWYFNEAKVAQGRA